VAKHARTLDEEDSRVSSVLTDTLVAEPEEIRSSSFVLDTLLRGQLGFRGIVATDALNMGAIVTRYGAAQAAVIAIAKSAALELAARRIRVNCVLTGPFDSPHLEETERELAVAARLNPLGRMPKADELAALAQFLLSEESAYITAASIPFDGGASAGAVAPNIVDALAAVLGTGRDAG